MEFKVESIINEVNPNRGTDTDSPQYRLTINVVGDYQTVKYVRDELLNHKFKKKSKRTF